MKGKRLIVVVVILLVVIADLGVWWYLTSSTRPAPAPQDPLFERTEAEIAAAQAEEIEGQFCTSAEAAKLKPRDFQVRKLTGSLLGRPSPGSPRVQWGGFPVVALPMTTNLMEVSFAEQIRRAAVEQSICSWAPPLLELQPEVVAAPGGFEKEQKLRVLLPVPMPENPVLPLVADTVEAGYAYVSSPMPSAQIAGSEAVASFLSRVREAGHTPRGPLFVRLDAAKPGVAATETAQLIQPIEDR